MVDLHKSESALLTILIIAEFFLLKNIKATDKRLTLTVPSGLVLFLIITEIKLPVSYRNHSAATLYDRSDRRQINVTFTRVRCNNNIGADSHYFKFRRFINVFHVFHPTDNNFDFYLYAAAESPYLIVALIRFESAGLLWL